MIIATANIKNYPDMRPEEVVSDGLKVSRNCDLWGMQENDPKEDLPAILDALPDKWAGALHRTNVPFLFNQEKLNLLEAHTIIVPMEPVLPLVARPRCLNWAMFELDARPGVPNFAVINTHMIAGGYNGPTIPRRAQQWDIEWLALKDLIRDLRAERLTVFVLGDLNHPRPPKPHPNFTWLVGIRLDRIGVTNWGPTEVFEQDSGLMFLHSDHNAQWVDVRLESRAVA